MKKTNEERIDKFIRTLEAMPEEERRAVLWIAHNYGFAVKLCAGRRLNGQARRRYLARALKDDDALMLCLLALECALQGENLTVYFPSDGGMADLKSNHH